MWWNDDTYRLSAIFLNGVRIDFNFYESCGFFLIWGWLPKKSKPPVKYFNWRTRMILFYSEIRFDGGQQIIAIWESGKKNIYPRRFWFRGGEYIKKKLLTVITVYIRHLKMPAHDVVGKVASANLYGLKLLKNIKVTEDSYGAVKMFRRKNG